MKTNITNGMAAERASRCENSTPASTARRPQLNSSARRPARPVNREMRRNTFLNSSVRPTSRRTDSVLGRAEWMKEIGMNCSRMECRDLFGHSKDEMVSGTARWDQTLERAYNDYYNEECNVNSARRPAMRRPVLNSSVRRPISRPVLNSSARRPLDNRAVLNSNRQSLRSVLEKAHAARLNSSLRPMPRRAKLNSSEEDAFDDADFDVTDNAEIIDTDVDNTAEAIPAEEVPTNDDGAVDVTELLIVQDPESKELSLFIQDTEDETLPESVEVIAAVDPATEADLDSSCGGKKKLNSSEEEGAENAAEGADDAEKADTDADADTDTAETAETEESVEIELADGDIVAVDDIYVVQSEDGELDLFIAEEGAELPESVEVVGEAVAVDESEVLDSSRKMIKRTGAKLNAGKKEGSAGLNSNADDSTDTITDFMGAVRAAGIPAEHLDHWQSDLYLKVTPETTALVNKYRYKNNVTKFIDNIDHEPWYEVPFAYYEDKQLDSSKKLNSGSNANKSFKELKETYSWSFKNYPDVSSVIGYHNIGFNQTTYTKQGSKWVEGEKKSNNVDWEFYLNTIDAVPFFKNMGGKEKLDVKYTKVGKVPFQVTSINPDGTEKIVRTFNFDSAERKAN